MLELVGWAVGILIVLWASTWLIKKKFRQAQTWHILSMLRFTKKQKIFDILRNHPKAVNVLTDVGIVLGFGAIAVDYLWMQKKPIWQRIGMLAISAGFLGLLVGFLFPTQNPIVPIPVLYLQIAFGVFGFAGLILVSLFFSGIDIYHKLSAGKNACAGVAPVIPGVDLPNSPISVPIHAWLSFVIILIVHEASHGFVARKLGMKLQSYGLLLLGFLPIGAFVEPDEKQLQKMEKTNPRESLRLYAAGPASNFYFFIAGTIFLAAIAGLVLAPLVAPAFTGIKEQSVEGLKIDKVEENIVVCGSEFEAPAHNVLFEGDQIVQVDENEINNLGDYVQAIQEKEEYDLTVLREGETITANFEPNELGRIGILVKEIPNENFEKPLWYQIGLPVAGFLASFFGWLLLLNFLIAVANYIPVAPFDGGKMVVLLLTPYLGFLGNEEKRQKIITKFFIVVLLALVLINAAPLIIIN
jgi:membrane-associated protease RseP (regulator of RpoE activity)